MFYMTFIGFIIIYSILSTYETFLLYKDVKSNKEYA